MAVIALDLGGTKLAGAVLSARGKILAKAVVPLAGRQGRAVGVLMQQQLAGLLDAAARCRAKVQAVAVSVPGISDAKTGTVWAPNIPGWTSYPLRCEIIGMFRRRVGRLPIVIEGDRACYISGEAWCGAAKGCRDAIFLAVGTGIGAGILSDGRLLRGVQGIAGAIGWSALQRPFRPDYVACGCFEHHASGAGLVKVARELLDKLSAESPGRAARSILNQSEPLTTHDIFAAYHRHDPIARRVLAEAVEFWGMAVANLVSLLNPEKIIFGGGVFGPATQFLNQIYREASKWGQPLAMRNVELLPSKLGADAGLYGAGWLALQAMRR